MLSLARDYATRREAFRNIQHPFRCLFSYEEEKSSVVDRDPDLFVPDPAKMKEQINYKI